MTARYGAPHDLGREGGCTGPRPDRGLLRLKFGDLTKPSSLFLRTTAHILGGVESLRPVTGGAFFGRAVRTHPCGGGSRRKPLHPLASGRPSSGFHLRQVQTPAGTDWFQVLAARGEGTVGCPAARAAIDRFISRDKRQRSVWFNGLKRTGHWRRYIRGRSKSRVSRRQCSKARESCPTFGAIVPSNTRPQPHCHQAIGGKRRARIGHVEGDMPDGVAGNIHHREPRDPAKVEGRSVFHQWPGRAAAGGGHPQPPHQ